MTAESNGYDTGREYIRSHAIEQTTFKQYRRVGKAKSEQYVRSDKKREYLIGWWKAGEQFLTLFQQDENDHWQAEKRIEYIQVRLGGTVKDFEELQEYREDDEGFHDKLLEAIELLTRLQDAMDGIATYVKRPT